MTIFYVKLHVFIEVNVGWLWVVAAPRWQCHVTSVPPGKTDTEAGKGSECKCFPVPTPRCEVLWGGRLPCSLRARLNSSCRGIAGLYSLPEQMPWRSPTSKPWTGWKRNNVSPKLWRWSMTIRVSDRLGVTSSSKLGLGISVARML